MNNCPPRMSTRPAEISKSFRIGISRVNPSRRGDGLLSRPGNISIRTRRSWFPGWWDRSGCAPRFDGGSDRRREDSRMNLDPKWVPMNWPCGPLLWIPRDKPSFPDTARRETLEAWSQPAALDLLKGTPVNCLVVDWADGMPEDSAQQQTLSPLLEAGRRREIDFVGKVAAGEGTAAAVESARAAGLSAVMLKEPSSHSFDFPVILSFPRDKVAWQSATQIFTSTGNEWPGLKLDTMKGDTAIAGPTGVPWVNSNAWFSLLSNELAPGKTRWLDFDPPDAPNLAHPATYPLAVADSQAYGSRWIISLDDNFRAALLKGNPKVAGAWSQTGKTIAFFDEHREWGQLPPLGVLAIISDFGGENAF